MVIRYDNFVFTIGLCNLQWKTKSKLVLEKTKSIKYNEVILEELKQRFKNLYLEEEQGLALIRGVFEGKATMVGWRT